ncbi:MAG: hypothetical protein M3065_21945 [Actinomycetota bacterium]|nr:hypothetical protein [Actinomycetota bacterium]
MIGAYYTQPDEFVHDLIADKDDVDRGVVRLTKTARPAGPAGASLTRVSVEAGAIVGGRLLTLRVLCGDLWGQGVEDEKVQAHATELIRVLEEQLSGAGFNLRAGLFTDPEGRS